MYLVERMFALSIYILLLLLSCLAIVKFGKKRLSPILFTYTVMLSLLSFFYVPAPGADLYRIFEIMRSISQADTLLNLKELLKSTSSPLYVIYIFVIGKTGIEGLLPALTCFIFYKNIFYILKNYTVRYKISNNNCALVLFFLMSLGSLIEVISGIRSMLSFSIIAVCCYKEMVENKSILKNILFYLIASLLHSTGLVLALIRIGAIFLEKNKKNRKKLIKQIILFIVIIPILIIMMPYISSVYGRALNYILYGKFYYFWEYVIGFISLTMVLFFNRLTFKLQKKINCNHLKKIFNFNIILTIIVSLSILEYNTFHRFGILLHMMSMPILLNLLCNNNYKKVYRGNFKRLVLGVSFFLLFLAAARGNLTSLKIFIL